MSIDDIAKEIKEIEGIVETIEDCIAISKQSFEVCKDRGFNKIYDLNIKKERLKKQLEALERYERQ